MSPKRMVTVEELERRIADLDRRIDSLEDRNDTLQDKLEDCEWDEMILSRIEKWLDEGDHKVEITSTNTAVIVALRDGHKTALGNGAGITEAMHRAHEILLYERKADA